jgi:hypothetical protein
MTEHEIVLDGMRQPADEEHGFPPRPLPGTQARRLSARVRRRPALALSSELSRAWSPTMIDIAANVAQYLGDRSPVERASSFDYCFNYFQRFRDRTTTATLTDPEHREASCLHLGYYLASWGMLRGSTALHTKSYMFFKPVIETIAREPPALWSIDANAYTDEAISALLDLRERLVTALTAVPAPDGAVRAPTDTLVPKVMLGVFGSVPAFDTYFVRDSARSPPSGPPSAADPLRPLVISMIGIAP